jgi:hypothetical protein
VDSPPAVRSVEEEDEILGRCRCGGVWSLAFEEVSPRAGRWYDTLIVKCAHCHTSQLALFDITLFFAATSKAWVRGL